MGGKWTGLDWGEGQNGERQPWGCEDYQRRTKTNILQTILQIGRKIIYMVQCYRQLYELERRKNKSLKYLLSKYKSTIIDGLNVSNQLFYHFTITISTCHNLCLLSQYYIAFSFFSPIRTNPKGVIFFLLYYFF